MTFYDAAADADQKILAPPKVQFLEKNIDAKNFSSNPNTKWLKSFSVPSLGFQHILSRLPLLQGSLPKNKRTTGNNFLRGSCQWRSNPHRFSKTPTFWKQKIDLQFFFPKNCWRQKIKSCKSSETRFAKVSRRSDLCSTGKRPFKVLKKKIGLGP